MLTPGHIRNKSFEKVRNGYRIEEVHAFLDELAASMEALYNENSDQQDKLEILAEKIEEYRENADALLAATIRAEKERDSIVKDAKRKAEAIIAGATRKSEEMIADAQANINRGAVALNKMQMEVAKFKSHILGEYKKHIEVLQEIPYDEADIRSMESSEIELLAAVDDHDDIALLEEDGHDTPPDNRIEFKFVSEDSFSKDDTLTYTEDDEKSQSSDNTTAGPTNNAEEFPRKRSSRFGTLRFGDDYSLTRKE